MCMHPICEACAGASAHSVCVEERSFYQRKHYSGYSDSDLDSESETE